MSAPMATRLDGIRVVLHPVPTGVGPTVWGGEFRTEDDRPFHLRVDKGRDPRASNYAHPVRFGRTPDEVLAALRYLLDEQDRRACDA